MASEQPRKTTRLRFFNRNSIIAVLAGLVLLLLAYWPLHDYPFWREFAREIGFALLVAVTIWGTYEFFAQAENEDHWNHRIETITRNVFFGVFKRNFPEQFIKEANILVLDHTFMRFDLHVSYTMADGFYTDRQGVTQQFVKLNAVARFKIKNVGNKPEDYPISIGLPNPLINEMKAACKVNAVTIKRGGSEKKPDLAEAEVVFREAMKDDNKYQVPFKLEPIQLSPDEEAELIFDYAMAKEDEDTEIFQTAYPTNSAIITIMDRGPTPRAVRARSIHMAPLENDTSADTTGTYNFKLDRYLLPHQGFAIWWKKVPQAEPPKPLSVRQG